MKNRNRKKSDDSFVKPILKDPIKNNLAQEGIFQNGQDKKVITDSDPFGIPIYLSSNCINIELSVRFSERSTIDTHNVFQLVAQKVMDIKNATNVESIHYVEGIAFGNKENSDLVVRPWIEYEGKVIIDVVSENLQEQIMYIPILRIPFEVTAFILEHAEATVPLYDNESYLQPFNNLYKVIKDYIFPYRDKIWSHLENERINNCE